MVKRMIWKAFECLLMVATPAGLFALCLEFFGIRATCIIAGGEIVVFAWFGIEFYKAPIVRRSIDAVEGLAIDFLKQDRYKY